MIDIILRTLWLILPAYITNPAAVLSKGKYPIDFYKNFLDKKRIFGNGKTWAGFFIGMFSGTIFGMIQNTIALLFPNILFPAFSANFFNAFQICLLLTSGAMVGDLLGSFIKRRLGAPQGSEVLGLDQLSFLTISLIFVYLGAYSFFMHYFYNVIALLTLYIFTPVIHRIVNIIGFKIGKKNVPW